MPRHVVVDGSNLATEGRALPSLKQLNEAVLAFMQDHPDDVITVVVDATFGHRIDPREVPEFDAAIENNELVAPPAGAVGRGDAFVLTIANKVKATILSNDSYQEFHGDYDWLFDEGRLIGGKPVPNVGWVFVPRVPVRGPVSRRAVKDATKATKAVARTSGRSTRSGGRAGKEASQPMPVPAAPPPAAKARSSSRSGAGGADTTGLDVAAVAATDAPKPAEQTDAPTAARPHMVNDLLPFLGFVEQHPVGSPVTGVVESYSSHGAYVKLDDARGYVPLRLMATPAPRSAREVMKLGEAVDLVVVSFNPTRRSIDLCVPGMEPPEVKALAGAPAPSAAKKRTRKKAAAVEPPAVEPAAATPSPTKRTRKKAVTAREAAAPAEVAASAAKPPTEEAPPPPAKRTRKKAAAAATPAPPPAAKPTPSAPRAKKAAKSTSRSPKKAADGAAASGGPAPAKRARKKAAPA
jgi:S1 RNA binding domain/Zc3h12a-like Ribonuclease NYN domain